jgi:cell division protein FtsB
MFIVKIAAYVLLGILLLLQYPLWFGSGGVITVWQLNREIEAQKKENAQLKERNRSELGMVKKGEVFYQVIDPKKINDSPQDTKVDKK